MGDALSQIVLICLLTIAQIREGRGQGMYNKHRRDGSFPEGTGRPRELNRQCMILGSFWWRVSRSGRVWGPGKLKRTFCPEVTLI